jgi:pyrimidine operon attenuation protein/uracil phosphoribosyltransferase
MNVFPYPVILASGNPKGDDRNEDKGEDADIHDAVSMPLTKISNFRGLCLLSWQIHSGSLPVQDKSHNMKILDRTQIQQKIKRLAIEILENNFEEKSIILAGINNRGTAFARLLYDELKNITAIRLELFTIRLNPAAPLADPISINTPIDSLKNKSIIIIDDVANTGRTIFYACKPILDIIPKKLEVAVLVDRKHKTFPILPKYVGLSLATTLKEDIDLRILETEEWGVYLN